MTRSFSVPKMEARCSAMLPHCQRCQRSVATLAGSEFLKDVAGPETPAPPRLTHETRGNQRPTPPRTSGHWPCAAAAAPKRYISSLAPARDGVHSAKRELRCMSRPAHHMLAYCSYVRKLRKYWKCASGSAPSSPAPGNYSSLYWQRACFGPAGRLCAA